MKSETDMKICVECKHYERTNYGEWHYCHKMAGTSNITGEKILVPCGYMRHGNFDCGESGKLWEPKDKEL